ncbi:hypothetical protein ASPBRDRAFT_37099 [Aspergillus brasiliensis CBS 101740]|uniref:Uncharacterized protein n=1 Tax=Aspergillus brasiliensis (strain CBS 101740 / IMI 381727 / IBT 21946) TaxID=767769 RepID=A0A1L9V232_ASPBC|nr:hypothetical protein ASPBRDRAFT_37099 [Aspergillus brasiliensis CBS 101740]
MVCRRCLLGISALLRLGWLGLPFWSRWKRAFNKKESIESSLCLVVVRTQTGRDKASCDKAHDIGGGGSGQSADREPRAIWNWIGEATIVRRFLLEAH